MQRLYDTTEAAKLFANAFLQDPAFALCLAEETDPKRAMNTFFSSYLENCKDLLLYTTNEPGKGYLCFYRWDKPPVEEFDCPECLSRLEEFQILDHHYQQNFAVLDTMAVQPAARGKGLAGEMIDFFVAYCRQEGLIPLTEIFGENHLSLYQRHGFEPKYRQTHRGITTYVLEYLL